jgi:hypothetical protein
MNDRIKELEKQCWSHRVDGVLVDGHLHFDTQKFAELIVRECSRVIVNGGYRNPAFGEKHPLTPPEIAKMIEEHFGVEE